MVEERLQRKLAAILTSDVVGYSRLMERDEEGTLAALKEHRAALIDPAISEHGGRIIKLMGDGMLVEFASVVDAVECAAKFQIGMAERNAGVPDARKIEFRIGINLGDVIVDGDDLYGDGVNVAARLQSLAEPEGICISGAVYDAIENKLAYRIELLGEQIVKNIEKPVRAYRVAALPTSRETPPTMPSKSDPSWTRERENQTIAVKPFETLGSDPEEANLADGITNGILVALTRVPGLTLIHDETTSLVESKRMTVQEMSRRFGARYIVKGNVRKSGGKIRVVSNLLEVSTGRYLWADHLDRDLRHHSDIFAIEDEIINEIVVALDVRLVSGEAARFVRSALKNPAARESLYRAEDLLWNAKSKLELQEAQRVFEDVIRLEPTSPIGYAQAAWAYWAEVKTGLSNTPSQAMDRATELAREAIERDDPTGYSRVVMCHAHLRKRNHDEALAEADRAVIARPSCPAAYSYKAAALNYLGQLEEAIELARFADRLTPVHPPNLPATVAAAYFGLERYEEAISAASAVIEANRQDVEPWLILAASNMALGRPEEARSAVREVLKIDPTFDLATYADSQPYKDQSRLDGLLTQLRNAGLE